MKRILLILFTIPLFLVACGSGELQSFTKDFNKNAKTQGIEQLSKDEFGEIEEEEHMNWRTLYESDEYLIQAKYKDGKNVSGYYLVIETDGTYAELKRDGFDAGQNIAQVLNLDVKKFRDVYEEAITSSSEEYMDKGYKVSYFYPGDSMMIVNFDEQ